MSYLNNNKNYPFSNIRIWQKLLTLQFLLSSLSIFVFCSPATGALSDAAIDWSLFNSDGYIAAYTYLGNPISDHETSSDPTNGGAAVSPTSIDLASASPGAPPGSQDTPSFGYYDGGTEYDPLNLTTIEDDYVFFRMRLSGDPSGAGGFSAYHWNILLDIDDDGYKEYWVDLEGGYQSGGDKEDRVQLLYDNGNTQLVSDPDTARVEQFEARHYNDLTNYPENHTRSLAVGDGSGDYWIEFQIPLTAFNDESGNQVMFPDSPVGFVFSTSASNTNPLQKDWMMDLDFLTDADPITFGDVVTINGDPIIEFVDSALEEVSFYEEGDYVYTFVKHSTANLDDFSIDNITITVTNPATDDDEQLTLCESSPNSGLFTNRGGAEITWVDDPDNGWISSVNTSSTTGSSDWDIVYDISSGDWLVYKDGSGTPQINTVTAGTEYSSDNSEITFTLYELSPTDGDTVEISTCAADPLPWVIDDGIPHNKNDDGELEFSANNTIQFSYTYTDPYSNVETLTTDTPIVGAGVPFIEFTRSSGLPNTDFELTSIPSTSDKLYVTVTHPDSNTNSGLAETIEVVLENDPVTGESQTLELVETGPDTGIFRNSTGLDTKVSDGLIDAEDALWEDVDSAEVTATYTWNHPVDGLTDYTTSANLFYVNGAGRVYFTNSTGTEDVDLYASGDEVYIKVEDANEAGNGFLTVTLENKATDGGSGDTETITVFETAANSGIFLSASGFTINNIDVGDSSSVLEANHDTIITVEYTDADDGDIDPGNNIKTDTATYFDPPVVINEVFFYPTPDALGTYDGQTEYFQIYNSSPAGSTPIDIAGYTITDGDGFTYIFPEMTSTNELLLLGPGEYAYVFLYSTFINDPATYDTKIDNTFYLFTDVTDTPFEAPPSDELGDPGFTAPDDSADQLTLKDDNGITQDYVAWSSVASPTIDFLSDDSSAVSQGIWQENNFLDVYTDPIAQGEVIKRITAGVDTDDPSDWEYVPTTMWNPGSVLLTPVGISSFDAHAEKNRVYLRWETSFERGTVGFYIFRKTNKQFMYELVNKKLIPALFGRPQGGNYQYHDKTALPGETYSYLLEEVAETGERIEYGPFTVTATNNNLSKKFSPELIRSARKVPAFAKKRQEFRRKTKSQKNRHVFRKPFINKKHSETGSLKISIRESGLYYLSSYDIAEHFGMKKRTVANLLNKYKMKLSSQGKTIPYFIDKKNPGIYFYGFEHKDVYTDENVFWLSLGSGQRMKNLKIKNPRQIEKNQSFIDTIHFEEESFPIYSQPWENTEDYWAWGYSFCGIEGMDKQAYNFHLNDIVPTTDTANLTLHFIGGSIDGAGNDHLAEVSLNGSWIGECSWKGIEQLSCELPFSQQLFSTGDNILEIKGILIGDAGFSLFYLDSFDVDYRRYYRAVDNYIQVPGKSKSAISINGFDSQSVYLLDVSNPYEPKFTYRTKVEKQNGTYRLNFSSNSSNASYLALSSSALKRVEEIEHYSSSRLKNKSNEADYIIITPADLRESVQELADYRSGQGHAVKIVELDQIINEFNDGIYSPMAIKKFLTYAHSKWLRPPQFAVLIGDASYDYRDVQGYGGNIMPTIFISSQHGLFPSDGYMADIDDDNIPDMAIGRLPVLTPEELQNIITKIKVYEYSSEEWKDKILLLADESDGDIKFAWDSEQISHLILPEYTQKKIYLTDHSLNDARQKLFAELDEGAAFVNYIGHGGPDRLAQQGLLLANDVNLLSTKGGAPIITAMTCAVGEFIFTNFDTLAELLLLQPNGGATAVWSASGLSKNEKATRLDAEFYKAIFTEGQTVLGKAILKSFENYSHIDDDPYHILVYNLLGDPALKIR